MTVLSPTQPIRARTVLLWAATSVLAGFFILVGLPKVLGQTGWVNRFEAWGYPDWFAAAVGLAEIAGAILLMIPSCFRLGAAVLVAIMLGAVGTHVWHGELPRIVLPTVLVALLTLVERGRRRARG